MAVTVGGFAHGEVDVEGGTQRPALISPAGQVWRARWFYGCAPSDGRRDPAYPRHSRMIFPCPT
ncbi:MAG: hypothetical protein JWL58_1599 [Streptosporangiaceae bacterium]|jgi:hypothetical protein|nr:hypothetical protein [Streptosporangiaceae bacterium]